MTTCEATLTKKQKYRACRLKKSIPGEKGRLVESVSSDRHLGYDNHKRQYVVSRVGKDGFTVAVALLGKNLERARVAAPTVYLRKGIIYEYVNI